MGPNAVRLLRLLGLAAVAAALLLLPATAFARRHAKSHHHRSHHGNRHDGDHHGNSVVGAVYTTVLASQANFSLNGLIFKMTLRF